MPDELLTTGAEAFGPVAGFIIASLMAVVVFLWRSLEKERMDNKATREKENERYIELLTEDNARAMRTTEALESLYKQLDISKEYQSLAMDILTKALKDKERDA